MSLKFPFTGVGGGLLGPLVALDGTNLSAAIDLSGYAYVNPANDPANAPRYNAGYFVDLPAWSDPVVQFRALATIAGGSTATDGAVGVLVNGVSIGYVQLILDDVEREYTVALPAGTKRVQLVAGWQGRTTNYDQGIDGACTSTYIKSVRVPPTEAAPVPRKSSTRARIVDGDSTVGYLAGLPWHVNGWSGLYRAAEAAVGGVVAFHSYGGKTRRGSGPTPAQQAQTYANQFSNIALPGADKAVILVGVPNDPRYISLTGSVQTNPTQMAQYESDTIDATQALVPGCRFIIAAPSFLIGVNERGPYAPIGIPPVGYSMADYNNAQIAALTGKPGVTILDGSTWGLTLGTDYYEASPNEIHPKDDGPPAVTARGQTKIANAIKAAMGL